MYVSSAISIFVSAAQARTAYGAVARPELARWIFFGSAGQPVPTGFERQIVGRVPARIAS